MKNKKRAQGHIEMIISFILFVSVVTILFMFLNPLSRTSKSQTSTEDIKKIVFTNLSSTIGKLSAIVDNENNNCYSIGNKSDISKNYKTTNYKEVQDPNNPRRYTIYFSDIFSAGSSSCDHFLGRNYTLGVYALENMLVYEKIIELKTKYDTGRVAYNDLRESLGITSDFMFRFMDSNRKIINDLSVTKTKKGKNVLSQDYPVRVIDNNANIHELILNIQVW